MRLYCHLLGWGYFLFSIFHFPFSIYHLPFTIFYFPFSIFHFPFSIYHPRPRPRPSPSRLTIQGNNNSLIEFFVSFNILSSNIQFISSNNITMTIRMSSSSSSSPFLILSRPFLNIPFIPIHSNTSDLDQELILLGLCRSTSRSYPVI